MPVFGNLMASTLSKNPSQGESNHSALEYVISFFAAAYDSSQILSYFEISSCKGKNVLYPQFGQPQT